MTRVNHEKLIRFVSLSFEKLGVPASDAEIAANVLVASDLRGVDTHGVIRFNSHAWYVKWLRDGAMTAKPNIRVVSESASTALLDAANGMGMVAGHRAMAMARQSQRVRRRHRHSAQLRRYHGMSAYYSMLALLHDMIGIAMTNASRQGCRPSAATRALHDPICFAVPAKDERPFVLDMVTNTAAAGKLELAVRPATDSPRLALNENAELTTDPKGAASAPFVAPRRPAQAWRQPKGQDSRRNSLRRAHQHDHGAQCQPGAARSFFRGHRSGGVSSSGGIQTRYGPVDSRIEIHAAS
jgi:LDH2 family malate/lactate/ureidoglycolate dehydrogenase